MNPHPVASPAPMLTVLDACTEPPLLLPLAVTPDLPVIDTARPARAGHLRIDS